MFYKPRLCLIHILIVLLIQLAEECVNIKKQNSVFIFCFILKTPTERKRNSDMYELFFFFTSGFTFLLHRSDQWENDPDKKDLFPPLPLRSCVAKHTDGNKQQPVNYS